ncbi:mechanosensitive ion channel family protein [Sphingosinicella microcystinivorans]|uniref:mechanosensitive ion channel family protein n=1 Tax=Sphingosinicella microcystinivorans TaxID=335406 RepID=UPI0022F39CFB|nr:mechanosensitive ion channel domain-containing protein [Sphingosinicella microcystinivorans]WBX83541.1 mechanosensitive ion channel [Sphingosinicella microcystinivorans]
MRNNQIIPASDIETLEGASTWIAANSGALLVYGAVAVGIYLVLVGVRAVAWRLVGSPGALEPNSWRAIFGRVLRRTRSFFLAAVAVHLVAAGVPGLAGILPVVRFLFTIAAVVQGAIWVREFALAVVARRAEGEDPHNSTLVSAMGVIRLIINVAIFAIAGIVILDNLGVNVTALVAGLGIGGIAIGLAAQGIFSDLFAALSILFDKPFVRGDVVTVDTLTGTVEAIGLKTTRIRSLSGELVSVSNAKLLDNRIHNLAAIRRRRVVMTVGVIYQTPPDVLESLPAEIGKLAETIPLVTFGQAFLTNFAASSIDIEIIFHVEAAEAKEMMGARQAFMFRLVRRFAELGVDFAYPTQMGFVGGLDGKAVDPLAVPREMTPLP